MPKTPTPTRLVIPGFELVTGVPMSGYWAESLSSEDLVLLEIIYVSDTGASTYYQEDNNGGWHKNCNNDRCNLVQSGVL